MKPGVVTGQALVDLLNYAKENEFAIPGVNVVSSSSVNACMEAAKKAGSGWVRKLEARHLRRSMFATSFDHPVLGSYFLQRCTWAILGHIFPRFAKKSHIFKDPAVAKALH